MAKTVPVKELRADLADLLDQVVDRREHLIVTRHGRPAAAIVPIDEYDALEETAEILSDNATLMAIERGKKELKNRKTVTLDSLRAEVHRRRK